MGKRSQRRLPRRRQENNVGCMSGLIQMFYSRHDAKLLLDRKQGSTRHTFRGFPGRGHSRKNSRDFEETEEDEDNMDECNSRKLTVKRLMDDELGKEKQLKIPNDEVQRILADLGHDVSLDKSATKNSKSKGDQNQSTSITVASPPGSLDPSGSKCAKVSEENELEDFLGQLHRYHDEWPHKNYKEKSELCTEVKFLIQAKLNELNNPSRSLVSTRTPQSEEKEIADGKRLCSSTEAQPEIFRDALEMLSSDTELFLKILQKKNSNDLENIQGEQNREIRTKLEATKMLGNIDSSEGIKSTDQHEATKTHGKESRHIFFRTKERSNRRHTTEGTNGPQPANKIVILKPNPRRGIDPTMASSSNKDPELSATENSKFSIKEVRRRFRIVTSEARKEKPSVCEDDLQQNPQWLKSASFRTKKDTRQVTENTSEEKASASAKNDLRPSTSSRQNQRNDVAGEMDSNIIKSSKDNFVFYDKAKKHLTELLKDKSQTTKQPKIQTSRSLVRMFSLPQGNTLSPRSNQCGKPSPRSSPRVNLSPEDANVCDTNKDNKKEVAKEESQLGEILVNVECCATETPLEGWQCMKEESKEAIQDGLELGTVHTEEIDKLGYSEKNSNARCIPVEQCRQNTCQNMVEEAAGENDIQKLECQEPATPRSSKELISQFSPDGNIEKQEQPSPVSVLDPFFHEDAKSTDTEDIRKCELHADIMRHQYTADEESDTEIFWVDKDARLGYIKAFLELSELCTDQNLEVWYLEDELTSPCLFEELHQGNQIDDTKLLFDCICEAVTKIQSKYFRSTPCLSSLKHKIRAPPMGRDLISEINKHVERNLQYQFPSTLDQLVRTDLEEGNWMDLQSESEEVAVVLWDFILDELIEEVVNDLWI